MTMIENEIAKNESYVRRLYDILENADFGAFDKFLKELAKMDDEAVAIILMRGFLRYYRPQKGDYIAIFMEKALRFNRDWAMAQDPNNPLIRTAFISGSVDLYDCYIEEAKGIDRVWFEAEIPVVMAYNQKLLDGSELVLIGRDYNTGLVQDGRRSIDLDDYEVMDRTIVRYNQIIGLRRIMKDILIRSGRQVM